MKKNNILIIILALCGFGLLISGIAVQVFSGSKDNSNVETDSKKTSNKQILKYNDYEYAYKIDAPYFGDITIGSQTVNMVTTTDEINKKYDRYTMRASTYEDEDTEDRFFYSTIGTEESYSIEFQTYNSKYEDTGCERCRYNMSNYIKLPNNITYDSTIDDVIAAYGEPKSRNDDYEDQNYEYNDHVDGGQYGVFEAIELKYKYNKDNVRMDLELYFDSDDETLYRVVYTVDINK